VGTLIAISRHFPPKEHVYAAEREILLALDWHVNAPIVMDYYCNVYLLMLHRLEQPRVHRSGANVNTLPS
jgi:hypothetical protein